MRVRKVLLYLVALGGMPSTAHALCAGFDDVPGNIPACSDVTWIRNRGITLGCNPPTNNLYCADQPVSRLAMALFMNRIGNVLSPTPVSVEGGGAALALATPSLLCETAEIPAATYERAVVGTAGLSFVADGDTRIEVGVAHSQNVGAFVQGGGETIVSVINGAPGHADALFRLGLNPGTTYRLAVRVVRTGTTSAAQLTGWDCSLDVQVMNRNP